jgi:Chitobiase/beta-hexosaminidase C-terminal domain
VKTTPPYIASGCDGGTVDRSHVVYLQCDTADAEILYTTDGSTPQLHLPDVKVLGRLINHI